MIRHKTSIKITRTGEQGEPFLGHASQRHVMCRPPVQLKTFLMEKKGLEYLMNWAITHLEMDGSISA